MATAMDMTAASELAVLRALERAGKRKVPRSERGSLNDVLPWEVYTHRPPVKTVSYVVRRTSRL